MKYQCGTADHLIVIGLVVSTIESIGARDSNNNVKSGSFEDLSPLKISDTCSGSDSIKINLVVGAAR
ncbi:hypothetical protein MARSALSMR5_04264 (plasmid) [Marinobacter salarius]|uniref:Uncharacterized protein n=1 Tax=Marinobacter salarius TaxID=1420917 RepID=A0A1W6KFV3_9GAMM|nr:hypothetical protein MARSALSMR5_04264 [Marinobacter salarius]